MKGKHAMGEPEAPVAERGKWMALTAALLGWMFDGLEMGLFPLVARPALQDLLRDTRDTDVGLWMGIATAGFLVGAATGGVLFGWLGDRIGRVRAMTFSVLTYALFSGICGLTTSVTQVAIFRFIAALGMGGEWSLGVALVMEIWPDRSRALLAGLIGAAANVGYLLIGVLSLGLNRVQTQIQEALAASGLAAESVDWLTRNGSWRILMLLGATPALLTFLIRLFVPESERWEQEKQKGSTSSWATQDLAGVLIGAAAAVSIIVVWAINDLSLGVRIPVTCVAMAVAFCGYIYPVVRYLQRAGDPQPGFTVRRMVLGACLGGVALLGTWASIQWAPVWADKLTEGKVPEAKAFTQIASAGGAIVFTILAAMMGDWLGRRIAYFLLCLFSLGAALLFFQGNNKFGGFFLATVFLAGGLTASFYGWLPLYLPELFRTGVRATGQGFSFNFGRIAAAIGALQGGYLTKNVFKEDYATVCSIMSCIYIVGMVIIWLAPETKGKALPE